MAGEWRVNHPDSSHVSTSVLQSVWNNWDACRLSSPRSSAERGSARRRRWKLMFPAWNSGVWYFFNSLKLRRETAKQQTASARGRNMERAAVLQYNPNQNVCFPSHLTGIISPHKNNTGLFPGRNTEKCWVELTTLYLHIKWRMNRVFSWHFNSDKDFSLTPSLSVFVSLSLSPSLSFRWSHNTYALCTRTHTHTHTHTCTHTRRQTHYTAHLVQRTGHFSHSGDDSYFASQDFSLCWHCWS